MVCPYATLASRIDRRILDGGDAFRRRGAEATAQIIFQNLCATCHGTKGEGKAEVKSPSIASLPAWYVERQLENFQRTGVEPIPKMQRGK